MRMQRVCLVSILALALPAPAGGTTSTGLPRPAGDGWQVGNTADVPGLRVTLSKPVLVGRSKGYLWFPTVVRLSTGELLAMMSDYADMHVAESTSKVAWSSMSFVPGSGESSRMATASSPTRNTDLAAKTSPPSSPFLYR